MEIIKIYLNHVSILTSLYHMDIYEKEQMTYHCEIIQKCDLSIPHIRVNGSSGVKELVDK